MNNEANELLPKQERLRTRWTAALDKIFADLVVEQIHQGNRPNNVFDKKTWNYIRDEFNRKTNQNFINNQLRKHLDVLRMRYHSVKSAYDQNDFGLDDSCCIGFDLWEDIEAQPKPETTKIKDCPIYGQLCTIFADSGADGKYAQSSHYEEFDKYVGSSPIPINSCPESGGLDPKTPSSRFNQGGTPFSGQSISKNTSERKRKRLTEMRFCSGQSSKGEETNDVMAKALLEMASASKLRLQNMPGINGRFTIAKCVKALDEIDGIDDCLYYSALDLFEEDTSMREMFLSLKDNRIRSTWLQGKCGNVTL